MASALKYGASHDAGHASRSSPSQPSRPSLVKGASLLILLQLISRLVSFTASQLLLRFLTPRLVGLSSQLEVYYLSVLFFARESLRVAIQRQGSSNAESSPSDNQEQLLKTRRRDSQAVVNLGYLAIVLGLFVSTGLGWMYLAYANESVLETPHLVSSLRLYGLAAMVELLSEPCFVLMQRRLRFGTRATAESAATLLRCLAVFGSTVLASRRGLDLGVLPFALGQVTYGVSLLLVYLVSGYRLAASIGFTLFPRAVAADGGSRANYIWSYFDRRTMTLASRMMVQSIVKHLLTQGDTLLISALSTPEVQGVYAMASNYGGLLARMLLQPVEESSRSYFSRLLVAASAGKEARDTKPTAAVQEAKKNLQTLLRLYTLLSAVAVGLGPSAAPPLLSVVAGRRWTDNGAGDVLGFYCFYIPFLALNGITESFIASVASETEVQRQSMWMGAFSVAFAVAAFVCMRVFPLGAQGLVLANIINMSCRVVWSWAFIRAYFGRHGSDITIRSIVPGRMAVVTLSTLVAAHWLRAPDEPDTNPVMTLAKVAGLAVPFLLTMVLLQRDFLMECFRAIREQKIS
ncbi:oligosaccharide translocation protein RFT1 [Metarhizium album ARSEF 1941]|uniref:Man(5)GlcNAc(2)-PP-dolichol translocation protein RFT1 n=1 Tax=Metarhizium album (strain ARSEF 1941) TaxID=1081103 RepID=A0A0B2WQ96_METAS|nr:oligosaccharide translocation protein RFT1 [Metarhizium album ARSEF 1941]KHN95784.1 oligosaccharide translocation protein RFT1 [Metarhizium album ARSEF 1941]